MIKHFTSDELYAFLSCDDYELFVQKMDDLRSRIKYFQFERGCWRDDVYVVKIDEHEILLEGAQNKKFTAKILLK